LRLSPRLGIEVKPSASQNKRIRAPLTELFKPLSESVSHRKKSCDGAGDSSIFGVEDGAFASAAGATGRAGPFTREVGGVETTAEPAAAEGALADIATGVADLPLCPTTDQAPP